MNTKTCKRCGWVYPITQPGPRCKMCGEPFEQVVCIKCGKVVSGHDLIKSRTICRQCHNEASNTVYRPRYVRKRLDELETRFDAWLNKIAQVPKNYPTLTEEQWLEACRFFNGCARCNSEDIDTRGFFIVAKLGGRYCDWNIIPLCERCAKTWDMTKSVFITALHRDYQNRNSEYRDQLEKIVEYLEVKLDAAIKYDTGSDGTTEGLKHCYDQ